MTQNIQDLINKIKQEGIEESQKKSQEADLQVRKKIDDMIARAKGEAEKIVADAKNEQKKIEQSTRIALQQASRDTILSLKQEINSVLMRLVQQDVRAALGKDQMIGLISDLAQAFIAQNKDVKDIEVGLSEERRRVLEQDLVVKLQNSVKAGLKIQTADDLAGGFTISFDEGKSCFDFSEEALVKYLSRYVNEYVANLLKN